MIFFINKSFRRTKRFFKASAANRWLILHFVVAIGLIAGTSSMLRQEPATKLNTNTQISVNAIAIYPSIKNRVVSETTDTICIRSVLLALLAHWQ